ncbi:MAG: cation diffusion facilitator family transporter [Deltaproteobacteria bacterium]|nr:cation diffusion facilitator family transporter [Deltaproteobacteria bacterium]
MTIDKRCRPLAAALAITFLYFVVEVIGGIYTNSLALLSDAGHMLSDIAALGLSLCAFQIARRPATPQKTFGYHRLEIVAALVNGLVLWLIVGVIFHEAFHRFFTPPQVQSVGMLAIATMGLAVNIVAGFILYRSHHESLNVHSAFLHVVGDALGSVGAMVAALIMIYTGWYLADPLISIFIGGLILYTSWGLIKESADILMQSVPRGISLDQVKEAMEGVTGVMKVHDLHIWAVTSGVFTLSAHAVVNGERDFHQVLSDMEKTLSERFDIRHTTIQLETISREAEEFSHF